MMPRRPSWRIRRGALLVTGGPGTGKTAVLRERFARLIEGGAEPERVVLVLGSRGARDAAKAALLERLPASLPGLQVLTFHGLGYRVLKLREGEPPEVLGAAEQFALVRELLAGQDPAAWPAYGRLLGVRGFADEVRQLLTRMQESLLSPKDLERGGRRRPGSAAGPSSPASHRSTSTRCDSVNQVDYAGLVQLASVERRRRDCCSTTCWSTTTRTRRWRPRRCSARSAPRASSSRPTPARTCSRSRG